MPGTIDKAGSTVPDWGKAPKPSTPKTKKEDGLFTVTARYTVPANTGAVVTLPHWNFPKKYPKQCRAVWRDLVNRLRVHEEGHVEIFKKYDEKFRERAEVLSREYVGRGRTPEEAMSDLESQFEKAEQELKTIMNDYDAEDREYDDVTEGGANPNKPENRWNPEAKPTRIQCPEECNRKPQPSGKVHTPSRSFPAYKGKPHYLPR
jgi:hypothetical protein